MFTDIADLKRRLLQEDDVDDIQDGEELTFGYLQPGHGIKGRQFSCLSILQRWQILSYYE